jgi:ADP-ribose pyrophosphatase YjhB (NUDIX family)
MVCYREVLNDDGVNELQYLIVQRLHTYEFIQFIGGNYRVDSRDTLQRLFKGMTPEEKNAIICTDFETLWSKVFIRKDAKYNIAKSKYEQLCAGVSSTNANSNGTITVSLTKKKTVCTLYDLIDNNTSLCKDTSWGFPKGGRESKETSIECAVREFCEETNYTFSDIDMITDKCICEQFEGTDGKLYRYIYFISKFISNYDPYVDPFNQHQQYEIKAVKWVTSKGVTSLLDSRKCNIINTVSDYINNTDIVKPVNEVSKVIPIFNIDTVLDNVSSSASIKIRL